MVWLSRGLFEALISFLNLAKNERFALRAAVYEFHYQPVANAFAKAAEAGADVKIVYDAESSYKEENEKTIQRAGLDMIGAVIPRTVSEGIRHNKFIVLLFDEKPIAVWTGSTNISQVEFLVIPMLAMWCGTKPQHKLTWSTGQDLART